MRWWWLQIQASAVQGCIRALVPRGLWPDGPATQELLNWRPAPVTPTIEKLREVAQALQEDMAKAEAELAAAEPQDSHGCTDQGSTSADTVGHGAEDEERGGQTDTLWVRPGFQADQKVVN
jgi:hypothetical protein